MPIGEHQKNKTHCPQGHPYSEKNTSICDGKRRCKECLRKRQRKRYGENPDLMKKRVYKSRQKHPESVKLGNRKQGLKKYGITIDQYEDLLIKQNGVCAICHQTCKTGTRLAVDHNHITGKIRGLLCTNCNRGIGMFQENILILKSAIQYLNKE